MTEELKVDVTFTDDELSQKIVESSIAAMKNLDETTVNEYECEVCGTKESLTEEQAYQAGWDYPPFIGVWGILSPRTCPNCTVEQTAYWFLITRSAEDQTPIPENHMKTIKRIMAETEGPSGGTAE